jgi:hypothetical protein
MWFIKQSEGIHTPWMTVFGIDSDPDTMRQCMGNLFVGCIYGTEKVAVKECKRLDKQFTLK